jgi:hypothetical protein
MGTESTLCELEIILLAFPALSCGMNVWVWEAVGKINNGLESVQSCMETHTTYKS